MYNRSSQSYSLSLHSVHHRKSLTSQGVRVSPAICVTQGPREQITSGNVRFPMMDEWLTRDFFNLQIAQSYIYSERNKEKTLRLYGYTNKIKKQGG